MHPLAGKQAPHSMLVNVPRLVTLTYGFGVGLAALSSVTA